MRILANFFAHTLYAVGLLLLLSPYALSHSYPSTAIDKQCPSDSPVGLQSAGQLGCPRPIESTASRPIDWSPWTHPPECLHDGKSLGTRYCVFTNSRHGNGGVSIITTPETAANSIQILDDSGYIHTKSLTSSSAETGYRVVEIPGKGKGMVTTRRINRTEVIMADWAAVIVDLDFPTSVKRELGYHLLHRAADQLLDPDRVLELARSSAFSADIMEDVLRTNGFSYPLSGEPHMALYPSVSVGIPTLLCV